MSKDWIGNSKAVYSILGASNHSKEDREQNDYYATSPIAVEKLLERESFSKDILEPCCGGGHISEVLKAHGYNVESSDLIDRGYGEVKDIFDIDSNKKDIITNPPYKCFDVETQCYTKRGWLSYNEIQFDDEVLSINPNTLSIEWTNIKQIIIRNIEPTEKMYHFSTDKMDIMVTSGHRMFAFSRFNEQIVKQNNDLIHSEHIRSYHYLPREGYSWFGQDKDSFVLPAMNGKCHAQPCYKKEIIINMDDWLRFFGMWLADGYCRHTKNSKNNDRKTVGIKQDRLRKEEIETILNALPFNYKEYEDNNRATPCINFEIHNEQLWNYLIQFGYSDTKYIPSEIKELSTRQLQLLIDSYFKGDGSIYRDIGRTYRTISPYLAEDIQEILLKLGYLSHITKRSYKTKDNIKTLYCINHAPQSKYSRVYFPSNKQDGCLCDYAGKVWCLTLIKNGVFLLRRNGKEFICGNCAQEVVEHALDISKDGCKVAMLLKIQFLESKKRRKLFEKYPPPNTCTCLVSV